MSATSTLKIDIIADVRRATESLDSIDGTLGKLTGGLGKVGTAVAGAFAVGAVAGFATEAAKAADEAAKVQRATEAIITATGSAAGVTADQVGKLAEELSLMSGVDDEVIQSGANLLLTFKNVKKAGDGLDDVFGRANKAALDLAAAGFGDVEGNAKMLGKALNDPAAGLTALTRAGVTFTDQQRQQIEAMTATGDVLGAQKIILAEVEAQVGGTAAATASSMDRIKVAATNAMEKVGAAILPVIDKLLPVFMDLMDELIPVITPVVSVLGDLAVSIVSAVIPAIKPLMPVVADLAKVLGASLQQVLVAIAPLLPKLAEAFARLITAVTPILPILADLLVSLLPILDPLLDIAIVVADLASKFLTKLTPAIRPIAGIFDTIARAIGGMIGWIKDAVTWLGKMIDKLSNPIIKGIGGIVGGVAGILGKSAPGGAARYYSPAGVGIARTGQPGTLRTGLAGGVTLNVYPSGIVLDPAGIGRAVIEAITAYETVNGSRWRTVPVP